MALLVYPTIAIITVVPVAQQLFYDFYFPLENIALNKSASMSRSCPKSGPASAAVDGNIDGNLNRLHYLPPSQWQYTCSESSDRDPWWRVDYGKTYETHTVIIYNRRDCCGENTPALCWSFLKPYWCKKSFLFFNNDTSLFNHFLGNDIIICRHNLFDCGSNKVFFFSKAEYISQNCFIQCFVKEFAVRRFVYE